MCLTLATRRAPCRAPQWEAKPLRARSFSRRPNQSAALSCPTAAACRRAAWDSPMIAYGEARRQSKAKVRRLCFSHTRTYIRTFKRSADSARRTRRRTECAMARPAHPSSSRRAARRLPRRSARSPSRSIRRRRTVRKARAPACIALVVVVWGVGGLEVRESSRPVRADSPTHGRRTPRSACRAACSRRQRARALRSQIPLTTREYNTPPSPPPPLLVDTKEGASTACSPASRRTTRVMLSCWERRACA